MSFNPGGGGSSTLSGDSDVALSNPANGHILSYNSGIGKWQNLSGGIPLATISMPGTLATGVVSLPFPINGTWSFGALIVEVGTASTGASIIVDMLYNGSTIYTTTANRPTLGAGVVWAAGGAPNTTSFTGSSSVRGYLQFSIIQVGSSGTEGSDLVATLYATRTS